MRIAGLRTLGGVAHGCVIDGEEGLISGATNNSLAEVQRGRVRQKEPVFWEVWQKSGVLGVGCMLQPVDQS